MSNGTASALNSEQDLASIPMAQGGLSRLAIARLKSAGVPVAPLLRRAGLTPELIAEPQELSVQSQITLGRRSSSPCFPRIRRSARGDLLRRPDPVAS